MFGLTWLSYVLLSSVLLVLSVSLSVLLKTSCLAVSQVGMFVVAGVIVGGFAVFVVVVVVVLAGVVVVVVVAGLLNKKLIKN